MTIKKPLVILLHEIYGVNDHMEYYKSVFNDAEFDVIVPNLLDRKPFHYSKEAEAYTYFMLEVGFEKAQLIVEQIINEQKQFYEDIYLVGFSIGATLAWLCSEKSVSAIFAFYGSRIRQYLHINPKVPTVVYFAKNEESFNPQIILEQLQQKDQVYTHLVNKSHGYMNPFDKKYDKLAADETTNEIVRWIKL
ncbi:dienelactone hydrolase family protein [Viridibacillus sp. FSL E2-0187]|uniref:dienelactone hydrolase family protein n=1 Tax=Viridibacillus TaxID=496496 RepID=UPI0030FCE7AB